MEFPWSAEGESFPMNWFFDVILGAVGVVLVYIIYGMAAF